MVEHRTAQVGFSEIYLLQCALSEPAPFEAQLVERRKVQSTTVEINGKEEWVAMVEMEAQHLTFGEFYLFEGSLTYFGQTQVASIEVAFRETYPGQVTVGEFTIPEGAILIFTFRQGNLPKIGFVESFGFDVDH
jgi:hypothetical protein